MLQAVFQTIASYRSTQDPQKDTIRVYCDNDARYVRTFDRIQLKTWWIDTSTHTYVPFKPRCLEGGDIGACKCNILYIHCNYNRSLIIVLYRRSQSQIRDTLPINQYIILRYAS
jgi:hypothetical protein